MNKKKLIFGILNCSNDYEQNYNLNKKIYEKIKDEYGNFCIVNLSNLRLFYKSNTKPKKKIPSDIKIFKPKNGEELIKIFKGKKLIAFNNLGKSFSYFKIYYYLKKIDLEQILLMNIGYINNKIYFSKKNKKFFFNSIIYFIRSKLSYYIFRILTILNIFPKISIYFESSKLIIKAINSGLSRSFEKSFPSTKFAYFRKIIPINSRSYDQNKNTKKTEKYISFIDSNFCAIDRTIREGNISTELRKKYYLNLKKLLFNFKKIFKKEIIICVHPKTKDKLFFSTFKNFKIKKYQTSKIINKSYLILFHESSAIMDAVISKKKIISVNSLLLGNYLKNRTDTYKSRLGLYSINLEKNILDKSVILKRLNHSRKNLLNYIKNNLQIDGSTTGDKKIIETLNKIYVKK